MLHALKTYASFDFLGSKLLLLNLYTALPFHLGNKDSYDHLHFQVLVAMMNIMVLSKI